MAALDSAYMNYLDLAKRLTKDGRAAKIIEMITRDDGGFWEDLVTLEGNLTQGHMGTVRTSLPTAYARKYNQGVTASKSGVNTFTASVANLTSHLKVDTELLKVSNNQSQFLTDESYAHFVALKQAAVDLCFYGNESADSKQINGLSSLYNSRASTSESARNVVCPLNVAPDSTDNTSLWLLTHGQNTFHAIYPKGSSGGIVVEDLGNSLVEDSNGKHYLARLIINSLNFGIFVPNWRYNVRIQIDYEDLTYNAASGPKLVDLLVQATHRIPNGQFGGKQVIYARPEVLEYLDRQLMTSSTLGLSRVKDAMGEEILSFRGIPLKACDALLLTESAVA